MITNYHDPNLDEDIAYQQWAEQRAEEQFIAFAEYANDTSRDNAAQIVAESPQESS